MRVLTAITIFLITAGSALAQTVSLNTTPAIKQVYEATISSDSVRLNTGNATLALAAYNYPSESDPSLKAFALPWGGVIVRENIANFVFYDAMGKIISSVSNSTGSQGGEAISELTLSTDGKTVVIYNPQFKRNGKNGSRARSLSASSPADAIDIFYSSDRTISTVDVSTDGELVAVASVSPGTDDIVHVVDRFGFNYRQITFDQKVKGVSFDPSKRFVTIYSGGRVAVYDLLTGERQGSTSIRNTTVQFANFIPEDNTIIALSGTGSEVLSEVEVHAINVKARKIARNELNTSIRKQHAPFIKRSAAGDYSMHGYTDVIQIDARF